MDEEKSRLEQFKEFVEMDPSDTFSRYALAMEYMGGADTQESHNAIPGSIETGSNLFGRIFPGRHCFAKK